MNPKSLDGSSQSVVQQTIDASAAKSTSLIPSKDPSKDIARSASGAKSAAAAEKPSKSSQPKAAAAAADKKAATAEPDKKVAAAAVDKNASAASEKKKTATAARKKKASAGTAAAENASAASKKMKVAATSAAAGKASAGEKKASAGEKKKAASTTVKESKKHPSSVWTKAHPKFTYGQAILTEAELLVAGPFTVELHNYYMKGCQGNKKNGIVVKYRRQHFWRDRDIEFFLVGFDDLYDLFKLDALDVSLLRCFTL